MTLSPRESRVVSQQQIFSLTAPATEFTVVTERLEYETRHECEFIDVTDDVREAIERSGVGFGQVLVSSNHTTAAVVVQEHEPLLLKDMARVLQRIAPADDYYEHNDFTIRTVNMGENEPPNGHSHCQHLFLGTSETLPVQGGALQLGIWQSIFLVELDHPPQRPNGQQLRALTVQVIGLQAPSPGATP
jgi:secondary thiamine-phosphate synthase enzyme